MEMFRGTPFRQKMVLVSYFIPVPYPPNIFYPMYLTHLILFDPIGICPCDPMGSMQFLLQVDLDIGLCVPSIILVIEGITIHGLSS